MEEERDRYGNLIDEGGREVYFYFFSYQDQEFTDTWKQCEDILSSRSTEFIIMIVYVSQSRKNY